MNLKQFFTGTALAALLTISVSGFAQADIFQFTVDGDGGNFNGAINTPSDSTLFTLKTQAPAFLQNNGTVSFMYQAGGPGGLLGPATLNVLSAPGAVVQTFKVNSVDWGGATAGASLTGLSAGGTVQEWQLSGALVFGAKVAPTTGSFGNEIDTIVWQITDYVDNTFGNTIDNLDFTVSAVPEPGSLALIGLGALGLFVRRRK